MMSLSENDKKNNKKSDLLCESCRNILTHLISVNLKKKLMQWHLDTKSCKAEIFHSQTQFKITDIMKIKICISHL